MRGLEAVDLPEDRLARGEDALGALEGAGVRGVLFRNAVALVVVELHDVALVEVPEDRGKPVEVAALAYAHHGIANLREESALGLAQKRLATLADGLRVDVGERVDVGLEREVALHRPGEGGERIVAAGVAGLDHIGGRFKGELRHGGHAGGMGAPGEHDLFAQALALALRRERRVVPLELVERAAAILGMDVGHHAARVVRRPVVSVDEARLHAVRLDLF